MRCQHFHVGAEPCTCPRYPGIPKPQPTCGESARLRSELSLAWGENFRLRQDAAAVRVTEPSRAAEQAKVMKRKLACLEAACGAALVIAVAAAVACVKWLVS